MADGVRSVAPLLAVLLLLLAGSARAAGNAFPADPGEWQDADADGTGDDANPDDDGDQLPDLWERAHGLDPLDPADAGQDLDGDGVANLEEYRQGSDPVRDILALQVGDWALDEAGGAVAADASGVGNDGRLEGGPGWVPGVFGTALEFAGAADRVLVADAPSLDATAGFALAAWVRPRSGRTQCVVKKAHRDRVDGYELALSSHGTVFVRFNQASGGNAHRLDSAGSYPADGSRWLHVAVSFDGASVRLYLDGRLDRALAAPGLLIAANDEPLSLGAQADGANPFRGTLDDVRLFAGPLTPAEVRALMAGGDLLPDADGDGAPDDDDRFPGDPREWADADDDGVGDNADAHDGRDGPDETARARPPGALLSGIARRAPPQPPVPAGPVPPR